MQHSHSIGNGLLSTGVRTYKVNGMVLVAWTQKRCKVCGHFLKKGKGDYCSKHGVGTKEYFLLNKDSYHRYAKKWRETHHEYDLKRHRLYNQNISKINAAFESGTCLLI